MSLTPHEAARIVEERITYRPNATLRIDLRESIRGVPHELALVVELIVSDTYLPTEQRRIQHRQSLSPWALEDVASLIREVRQALHRVELHEADEWLKVDGHIVFNPHEGRDDHARKLEELAR